MQKTTPLKSGVTLFYGAWFDVYEFKAIRIEMDVAYKMLSRDIASVNDKVDRFLHTKDIEGYESMRIQVDLLTQGYQELKARIS